MQSEGFLPITYDEMRLGGIEQPDFVYVTGDAYVDHPSFGHAVISRVLLAHGYSVCIISQPDWRREDSISIFGRPRLGFLVSAGNMDSMVNHYYVSKKRRTRDAYTPGGIAGKRPDYAVCVYSKLIRRVYGNIPVIIGGIEASLRRMAHYDYWSDSLKRSVLLDSGADIISYGMGERSIVELADALASGIEAKDIGFIRGTVYKTGDISGIYDYIMLPPYEALRRDKLKYAESFRIQHENTDHVNGKTLIERYEDGVYVVQNPPQPPLTQLEMDDIYGYPYMRDYHPSYREQGGVPAVSEIKLSLISSRGCYGGCSFCALTFHQGRIVQSRSHESILREAKLITEDRDFKGYIHDVGGPTANFRAPACEKQLTKGVCTKKQCLFPGPCSNLKVDHTDYVSLLRKLRKLPGVRKVFVRSGVRFDYIMADKDDTFLKELIQYHVSGQLKVAPEHVSDRVLRYMGKPGRRVYEAFVSKYNAFNEKLHLKQYLVPYLMSSHPGSSLNEAIELAEHLKETGHNPEQVQDFYPTPSTMATCMYYTGVDPRDMKPVYICRNPHEKAMQRALIQFRNPDNYELVREALIKAGREDLIGFDKKCLIPPRKLSGRRNQAAAKAVAGRNKSGSNKSGSNKSGRTAPVKNKQAKSFSEKKTGRRQHD